MGTPEFNPAAWFQTTSQPPQPEPKFNPAAWFQTTSQPPQPEPKFNPAAWFQTTCQPAQPGPEFDKAAWIKSMMLSQAAMITPNQWALVTNQNNSIQNMMQNDNETGTSTKPPKLMHINDFGRWKERLRTYVQGQSTELWMCFSTPFDQALETAQLQRLCGIC